MEGQKLKIPEDPSQTLPGRGRLWAQFVHFFFNFPVFWKKTISRGDLGQHLYSQTDLGFDAA